MPSVKSLKQTLRELTDLYETARLELPIPFKEAICHEELARLLLPALRYLPKVAYDKNGRPSIVLETLGLNFQIVQSFSECKSLVVEISKNRLGSNIKNLKQEKGVATEIASGDDLNKQVEPESNCNPEQILFDENRTKLALSLYFLLIELRLDIIEKLRAKKRASWIAQNDTNIANLAESIRSLDRSLKQIWHIYALEDCSKRSSIEEHLAHYIYEEEPAAMDPIDFQLANIVLPF